MELEKEKETLKARQTQCQNEVGKAIEEEIPLRQELKRVQTDFDMVKKKLDAEDGRSSLGPFPYDPSAFCVVIASLLQSHTGERQSARIECNQLVTNFDQTQKRVKAAEAEGFAQKLEEMDLALKKLDQDILGYEEQLEDLKPRINHVLKNLQDKDRNRQQIEVSSFPSLCCRGPRATLC